MTNARAALLVALVFTALSSSAMARSGGADPFGRCTCCHKSTGLGVPGYSPPLAAHVPDLENIPGGRTCLIQVLLHGLKGEIRVDGQRFDAAVPAFAGLGDVEAAAALNRILTDWGNDKLLPKDHKAIDPGEVNIRRESELTAELVYKMREKPGLK